MLFAVDQHHDVVPAWWGHYPITPVSIPRATILALEVSGFLDSRIQSLSIEINNSFLLPVVRAQTVT